MTMSYVLYIGLLVFCWAFALLADRYDSKKFVWMIVIVLSLVSGLRGYSVGIDTAGYVEKFSYIKDGALRYAYGLEESFKYICYAVLKVFPNYSVLMTVLAFITNGCIIWRLWDLRRISSFTTAVSCYYMGFFFMTLNTMRQFCAIAILFFATKYLSKHQDIRYIILVLVASCFHQSGLIGLVFLVFGLLRWKELSTGKRLFFLAVVAASPLITYIMLLNVARYEKYFAQISLDIGFMVPAKILFFAISAFFIFYLHGRENHFVEGDKIGTVEKNNIFLMCSIYAVGLGIIFLSYFMPMMNRIGWYFTVCEGACMGMLMKTRSSLHKFIFGWLIVGLIGYGFVSSMLGNDQGVMPFLFVWQR